MDIFNNAIKFLTLMCAIVSLGVVSQEISVLKEDCKNNYTGPRKSTQCTFYQPKMGMVWKGSSNRARKLHITKPEGDTGLDVVRLWIDNQFRGEFTIDPGYKKDIFLKHGESTINARVEVETVKLPASGPSTIYVHFETLDKPVIYDLSNCSNTVNSQQVTVCMSGKF